ncbi:MAG: AlpA family phage regulatory protein [Desulfobulbaceae bacterium]|nr:AlpA family phage regulatory protein [Desulfobulbaceae bacterium]
MAPRRKTPDAVELIQLHQDIDGNRDREHTSPVPITPLLPPNGFLRLSQIVGDNKAEPPISAIIPVSKSTWWAGVKSGRYPQPVKLSERCTAWRVRDILELAERL